MIVIGRARKKNEKLGVHDPNFVKYAISNVLQFLTTITRPANFVAGFVSIVIVRLVAFVIGLTFVRL